MLLGYRILLLVTSLMSLTSTLEEVKYEQPQPPPGAAGGSLYPHATATRDVKTLNGIWNFRLSPNGDPEFGFKNRWNEIDLHLTGPIIPMPVPSSYNDVGEDPAIRDHVGVVWYDRRFYVPSWWIKNNQRVWLRFSSVHYSAQVFVNGRLVMTHEMGHLPFEEEITHLVATNTSNLLTVAVDNMLLSDTVPQGNVYDTALGNGTIRQTQTYTFDFFNYAGIHRSVFLYSTPQIYIDDVIVNTDIQGLTGFVVFNVTYDGTNEEVGCLVELFDRANIRVAVSFNCANLMEVGNAHLWWPYLMNKDPGYLYTLKASLTRYGEVIDTYEVKIGFRTVTWNKDSLFLNNQPLYLRGFGMHEDSDIRGKGWDQVLWTKNFNLLKWTGANAFRTSHYPYAEEIYQMADEHGIMIIDECPSVDTDIFTPALLRKHKQSLTELIYRDKNHPSVIMWSIANEPKTQKTKADQYFAEVVSHVKRMDLSRPVTIALSQLPSNDKAAQHLDVVSFNRYNGWYSDTGNLRDIAANVYTEAMTWHHIFKKPVIMMEYGADTIAGLHLYPEYVWSEEFQVAYMSEHFKAFDKLRKAGYFIGEFIWNFADFKTVQSSHKEYVAVKETSLSLSVVTAITRVGGNKKGVFDRSRQPKASAHHLRARYLALAAADANEPPPSVGYYISDNHPALHEEL